MFLTFRQGIVKSNNDFIVPSGLSVTLQANSKPAFAAAHILNVNYYISETTTIPNAWTLTDTSTHYLYIDINTLTGVRTFGTTKLAPTSGPTPPATPATGQLWFDTNNGVMNVYANSRFSVVIRVVVGTVTNGIVGYYSIGSNVGVSSTSATFKTGTIMKDSTGNALRSENGTFISTETRIHTTNAFGETLTLEAHVLKAIVVAQAIVAGDVVVLSAEGTVTKATYAQTASYLFAIAMNDAAIGQEVELTLQGVVSNTSWNWTVDPGSTLWVDQGALVDVDPYTVDPSFRRQPPRARVIDGTTVWFDCSLGTIPHAHIASEILMDSPFYDTYNLQQALQVLDTNKVDIAGDTMTGPLYLYGSPQADDEAATKGYVDSMTLERLGDVSLGSPQLDDVLVYNGAFWTNAPVIVEETDDGYVTVDVTQTVLTSGIVYDVNTPTLKINIDSDEPSLVVDIENSVGTLNIDLQGFTEDRPYVFTVVVEHLGTAGNVYVNEFIFNEPIKWVDGIKPTVLPNPYNTLVARFIIVPENSGASYTICGEWAWHASEFAVENVEISPFRVGNYYAQPIDPEPIVFPDGTLMILGAHYDPEQPGSLHGTVECTVSTDGGFTWTDATQIFNGYDTESQQVPIFSVCATIYDDVVYVVVGSLEVYELVDQRVCARLYKSNDHGISWSLPDLLFPTVYEPVSNLVSVSVDIKIWYGQLLGYNTGNIANTIVTATIANATSYYFSSNTFFVGPDFIEIHQPLNGRRNGTRGTLKGDRYFFISPDTDIPNGSTYPSPEVIPYYFDVQSVPVVLEGEHIQSVTSIMISDYGHHPIDYPSCDIMYKESTNTLHVVYPMLRGDLDPKYQFVDLYVWATDLSVEPIQWSTPSPIAPYHVNGDINDLIYNYGVELNFDTNDTLHASWYRFTAPSEYDPTNQRAYFLYTNSTDGGVTWGAAQVAVVPSNVFDDSNYPYGFDFLLRLFISRGNTILGNTAAEHIYSSFSYFNTADNVYEVYFTKRLNGELAVAPAPLERPQPLPAERYAPSVKHQIPTKTIRLSNDHLLNFVIEYQNPEDAFNPNELVVYESADEGDTWVELIRTDYNGSIRIETVDVVNQPETIFSPIHVAFIAERSGDSRYALYLNLIYSDLPEEVIFSNEYVIHQAEYYIKSIAITTTPSDVVVGLVRETINTDYFATYFRSITPENGDSWIQAGDFGYYGGEGIETLYGVDHIKFSLDTRGNYYDNEYARAILADNSRGTIYYQMIQGEGSEWNWQEGGTLVANPTAIPNDNNWSQLPSSEYVNIAMPSRGQKQHNLSSVTSYNLYITPESTRAGFGASTYYLEGEGSLIEPFTVPAGFSEPSPFVRDPVYQIVSCDIDQNFNDVTHATALVKYTSGSDVVFSVLYTNKATQDNTSMWGVQLEEPVLMIPGSDPFIANDMQTPRISNFGMCFDSWGDVIVTFALEIGGVLQTHRTRFNPALLDARADNLTPMSLNQFNVDVNELATRPPDESVNGNAIINVPPSDYGTGGYVVEITPPSTSGSIDFSVAPIGGTLLTYVFVAGNFDGVHTTPPDIGPQGFTVYYDFTYYPENPTVKLVFMQAVCGNRVEAVVEAAGLSLPIPIAPLDDTGLVPNPTVSSPVWEDTNTGGFLLAFGNFAGARTEVLGIVPPSSTVAALPPDEPSTHCVARWNGAHWNSVSSGMTHYNNINAAKIVDTCRDSNNDIWVCGDFTSIDGVACTGIAKYVVSTGQWVAGPTIPGTASDVFNVTARLQSIAVDDNDNVYIGGSFYGIPGVLKTQALAKWNGSAWVSIMEFVYNWTYVSRMLIRGDELFISGNTSGAIDVVGPTPIPGDSNYVVIAINTTTHVASTYGYGGPSNPITVRDLINGEIYCSVATDSGVKNDVSDPAVVPNTAYMCKIKADGTIGAVGPGLNSITRPSSMLINGFKYDSVGDVLYIYGQWGLDAGTLITTGSVTTLINNMTTFAPFATPFTGFVGGNAVYDMALLDSTHIYGAGPANLGPYGANPGLGVCEYAGSGPVKAMDWGLGPYNQASGSVRRLELI